MLGEIHVNSFPLPASTPAVVPYPNLVNSTQYAQNNFVPRKRKLERVIPGQESDGALEHILKKYWGYGKFRDPQLKVIHQVLLGRDVIVVAPTGIGKSLCFQLPAIAMEHGITLVISPLIALMKDQVIGLKDKGISVAMACEYSTDAEVKEIKRQLKMGHPEIRLLYLTPETLFSPKYAYEIRIAEAQRQLVRLVVDEAHVIDEWGMTFRPMYRNLGQFRLKYPGIPITALTASATKEVREDIQDILRIPRQNLAQFVLPFNRKNLFYEIKYKGEGEQSDVASAIAAYIREYRVEAAKRNTEVGLHLRSVTGLIYCRSRDNCEYVAEILRKSGIKATAFHAKLAERTRNELLFAWKEGKIECMVATIAFGMGVDQPHVRYVFHYDLPKSFEGYYQETGRAGRDGHTSRCVLYYSREDARRLRNMIEQEANKTMGSNATAALKGTKDLQTEYAEKVLCRHIAICRYFGEKMDETDQKIKEAYCNGMCDVCADRSSVLRHISAVTEDIPIASQIVPPPARSATGIDRSYSLIVPDSLAMLHGSDMPLSSDSPESLPLPVRLLSADIQPSESHQSRQIKPAAAPGTLRSPSTLRTSERQVEKTSPSLSTLLHKAPSTTATKSGRRLDGITQAAAVGGAGPSEPGANSPRSPPSGNTEQAMSSDSSSKSVSPPKEHTSPASDRTLRPGRRVRTGGGFASTVGGVAAQIDATCAASSSRGRLRGVPCSTAGPAAHIRTTDSVALGEGSCAVAAALPESKKKRKAQQDAFRQVEPVSGDGPFPVYNQTAPAAVARRTPAFKPPLIRDRTTFRHGPVAHKERRDALRGLQAKLCKILEESPLVNRLWEMLGRNEEGRQRIKVAKRAMRELEEEIVTAANARGEYKRLVRGHCEGMRLLAEGTVLDALEERRLVRKFGKCEVVDWVGAVERSLRGVPTG